ncbi:aconitase X [Sinanaerobacter sp. ZZT-01]|uniref:aconitase X n=1 Tax=Sinanaerobacter sp. ZZT-01 TaxID=3111540 RepID=UPI002D79D500|nr:aconitase X [Sinanaerobacter sp. ZZT-01]WRR93729.1 aconitase X [Sinanaerobacter sp. ZZT-01]
MRLTNEEQDILNGKHGEILQKTMETLVRYGDMYDAECLVSLDGPVHLVCSFGMPALKPLSRIMKEMIDAGIRTELPFTADPQPIDYENVPATKQEQEMYHLLYGTQKEYESMLAKLGMKNENAYTCACYFDEVGNTPKFGDNLAWAESSAVVYANSVLGARTNRTSGVMEFFSGIIGKTPKFGFLTDEGRKADWIIELRTSKLPRPQILGSAIGRKVVEKVPYVNGLEQFLGTELTPAVKDYLKDMGAATASNGAVGLYHVDNLTPESKKYGEELIRENASVYVIDDAELERVVNSYPILWEDLNAKPDRAFIGCPHASFNQLKEWTETFEQALEKSGQEKVTVNTIITSAPDVIAKFKETEYYTRLMKTGVKISHICPLMYMSNPLCAKKPIITNSNKLRTYSTARYVDDQELVNLVVKGAF